jgi:hypothetical protein
MGRTATGEFPVVFTEQFQLGRLEIKHLSAAGIGQQIWQIRPSAMANHRSLRGLFFHNSSYFELV